MTIPELAQAIRVARATVTALEAERDARHLEWLAYYDDPAHQLAATVRVAGKDFT
jgi:DNA-binding XRE family transcriptional regulator